jgi:flagellar motor protein MotB
MVTLLLTVFIILLLMAGAGGTSRTGNGGTVGGGNSAAQGFLNNIFELRAMSPYADADGYVVAAREGAAGLSPEQRAGLTVIKDEDLERIRHREEVLADIRTKLEQAQLDPYISADAEGDGIRLKIPNSILFPTGTVDVDNRGLSVLRALVPILSSGDFAIAVEGHTDGSRGGHSDKFASDWELSANRATTIVRFLIDAGIAPKRLEAVGYADTRPIADNSTEAGRAANRRVALLLRM